MRQALTLAILIFSFACGRPSDSDQSDNATGVMRFFDDFPNKQFAGIALGDKQNTVLTKLKLNGYKEVEGGHPRLINNTEEVEILFVEEKNISSFKVFIYNKDDIEAADELKAFFKSESLTSNSNDGFSYFEFSTQQYFYKLTMFEQKDFLRLNFELKTAH